MISLEKGQKINLSKDGDSLDNITVKLSWDTKKLNGGYDYDLDMQAFCLGEDGLIHDNLDFIFYNNLKHPSGALKHLGDNLNGEGNEVIIAKLNSMPESISKIVFTTNMNDAVERNQNFGQVAEAFISLVDEDTKKEVIKYDIKEEFSIETALIAFEVERVDGTWKLNAIGSGFDGGLRELCTKFGLSV